MSTLSVSQIQNTASPTTNIVVNADGSVTLGLYRTTGVAPAPVQTGTLWYDVGGAGLVIWDGAAWVSAGGAVSSVSGTAPIVSSGGANPVISATLATAAQAAAGTSNVVLSTPAFSVPKDAATMTGAAILPAGTDAQRAAIASPVAGMQRFNTTQNSMEYYDGTNWRGPYEYIQSAGWFGGSPGAIAQQFVTSNTEATFNLNAITLTPGTWLVALNFYAQCSPNNPAGVFSINVTFPYAATGGLADPNIIWCSKPDGPFFRSILTSATPYELDTVIAMKVGPGNVTLNQIKGSWGDLGSSGAGPHDLKINAWFTAMRID
jgi:hypothetical protein